jgi:hypothetical protein
LGGDVTATRASLIVAYVVVSNVVAARAKSEWSSSLRCSQIVFFQIEIRIRIFCFSFCSVEVICLIVIRLSELWSGALGSIAKHGSIAGPKQHRGARWDRTRYAKEALLLVIIELLPFHSEARRARDPKK